MRIKFISIIMPVWNDERFILDSIQSVLNQTFKNFELIIINDASTDNSLRLIQEKANLDKRIKVLSLKKNLGMANALNEAIKYSKGEYIARMDSDDLMYENRIEEQVKYMNNNEDVEVLSCLGTYLGVNGNNFGVTSTEIINHQSFKHLIRNNKPIGLLHPGTVFKKKIVQEIGGYNKIFWPAEDIDLWNRLALKGHVIYVQKKILMKYRIHENSIITSKFLDSYNIYKWVKYCLVCKNMNKPEIGYADFIDYQKKKNIFIKINNLRKLYYSFYLRKLILYILNKNFLKLLISIFLLILLRPFKFFNIPNKRLYIYLRKKY